MEDKYIPKLPEIKCPQSRNDVLVNALDECLYELFQAAQPSIDIREAALNLNKEEEAKSPTYTHHYLSQKDCDEIVDKYIDIYQMRSDYKDSVDRLLEDLLYGGYKTVYTKEQTLEDGTYIPSERSLEKMPTLEQYLKDDLKNVVEENKVQEVVDCVIKRLTDLIKHYRDFYKFDNGCSKFQQSIYLGCCPTSNKEEVIAYWKSQGKDIEIKDNVNDDEE